MSDDTDGARLTELARVDAVDDIDQARLSELYAYPDDLRKCYVRGNMITSLDGGATEDGKSGGLAGTGDRAVSDDGEDARNERVRRPHSSQFPSATTLAPQTAFDRPPPSELPGVTLNDLHARGQRVSRRTRRSHASTVRWELRACSPCTARPLPIRAPRHKAA